MDSFPTSQSLKTIGGIAVVVFCFWAALQILDPLDHPGSTAATDRVQAMNLRDAQRRSDVEILRLAIEAYFKTNGTYRVKGSEGAGYINLASPGALSVVQALHDGGYLAVRSLDDPTKIPGYMIYLCDDDKQYSISATLENPSPEDVSRAQKMCNGSGPNGTYTVYGKNYSVGTDR